MAMSPEVEMLTRIAKLVKTKQIYGDSFEQEEMLALWEAHQNLLDFWNMILEYRVDDEVH